MNADLAPAVPVDRESIRDARLRPAIGMLEGGEADVLSLDAFDTLLWRTVPEPTDVFVLLAHRLVARRLLDSGSIDLFARTRVLAEHEARARTQRERGSTEVSLREIYESFPAGVTTPVEAGRMAALEVEQENAVIAADLDVLSLALRAQSAGARVVLVSNTYLSSADLARLVATASAEALSPDRIFASSEHGVHKAAGLLKVMLKEMGTPAARVLHVGDDAASDVRPARGLGMRAIELRLHEPGTREILLKEGLLGRSPSHPHKSQLDPVGGDFGLTSIRAKAVHVAETDDIEKGLRPYWSYGAFVLGPAMTGFAEWVLERAAGIGAGVVHCPMREGELLSGLINEASASRGSTLRARPVWLSRYVTARAAIHDCSVAELSAVISGPSRPTLEEFCSSLGLDVAELGTLARRSTWRLDDPELANQAVHRIASTPRLSARARAAASRLRDRLIRSLAADLDGARMMVLADVGWGATTQQFLQRALQKTPLDLDILGLYMLTNDHALRRSFEGVRSEGYLCNGGYPVEGLSVLRTPEIIERSCLAACGTLLDLTDDLAPVLGPPPDRREAIQVRAVQLGIRAFERQWLRYERTNGTLLGAMHRDGRRYLLRTLARSTVQPTQEEAIAFGKWRHEDNFGVHRSQPVAAADAQRYLPYLSPADVLQLSMRETYWPAGTAAGHSPVLAAAVGAIADGTVPAQAFMGTRPGDAAQLYALGPLGPVLCVDQPAHTNAAGLAFARAKADNSEGMVQAIRFDPSRGPCLLRIDWIRLACVAHSSAREYTLLLDSPQHMASLELVSCDRIDDRLFISRSGGCQITLPISRRLSPKTYSIDVEIAYALVPLDAPVMQMDGTLRFEYDSAHQRSAHPGALGDAAGRGVILVKWMYHRVRDEYRRGGTVAVAQGVRKWLEWRRRSSG